MSRSLILTIFLALLLAAPSFAQTRIEAGVALGTQAYEESGYSSRVLSSAEVLFQHRSLGVHVAVEYADFSSGGAMYARHLNLVYRRSLGNGYSLLIGAGPTFVNIEAFDTTSSWNAELELSRRFGNTEVFARVRQYDFKATGFRARASPSGPAAYLGARFTLKH